MVVQDRLGRKIDTCHAHRPRAGSMRNRYKPCLEVRYKCRVGRVKSCHRSCTPPLISPPTKFALRCSSPTGERTLRARNERTKARSKSFDLRFNAVSHIHGRSVGNVTVGPGSVLSRRCARRIEKTWLSKKNKRVFSGLLLPRSTFSGSDLSKGAT